MDDDRIERLLKGYRLPEVSRISTVAS